MKVSTKRRTIAVNGVTIGLDVSDKVSTYVVLDASGAVVAEGKVGTRSESMAEVFGGVGRKRIAMEVGTHSPWLSRALEGLGHEVIVANPRQVRLISRAKNKSDRVDAESLGRLARVDPLLLHPIKHRGKTAQADLALLKARDGLVRARTALINQVRSQVKATGSCLPRSSTDSFHKKASAALPTTLAFLLPLIDSVGQLTEKIRAYNEDIERLCEEVYPETKVLRQVNGVGPITSLAFVLTIEEPGRFAKSRQVGAYLGLTPRQADSGARRPQLRITKAGDESLRRLLVQSAHYILGPFGADCELRRWGLKLAGAGNKGAKKRAVAAVARKLSVLLHRLWATGQVYDPFHTSGGLYRP